MGLFDFFGGDDDDQPTFQRVNIPGFEENEDFSETQGFLKDVGYEIINTGKLSNFENIGQTGGPLFEQALNLAKRDVTKSIDETLAKTGTGRSGVGASIKSKRIADLTTKLRYDDLLNAVEGKKFLLDKGLNTVTGVRNSALDFTNLKNQFNLNKAGLELKQNSAIFETEKSQADSKNAMWSEILSSGIGLLGTAAGFAFGGPTGGAIGGSLASSLGSASKSGSANRSAIEYGLQDSISNFGLSALNF